MAKRLSKRQKTKVSGIIKETLHKFKQTGKIGTSRPASMRKAQKQAAAIAFSKAGGKKRKAKR